jgi:hypothetical protein
MPRLPDASNLSGVNIGAPRSMVDMPVPDIAGAAGAVARDISDAGQAVTSFAVERQERFRKQERFDTKMGLLKAEEAYAERVKDLDPLDPEYVEKKKAFRREVFAPVLSAVKDPENKQFFDLSTYEDFVNVGLRAEGEHRQARLKKTEIDISTFADTKLKTVINGGYTGDPLAEVEQQIDDSELDETAKLALKQKYRSAFNATTVDTAFSEITTKGYTLRPDVQTAIAATAEAGAPDWMRNYLERLAAVESAGGYNLSTNLSTAGGIYAFTDSTGRQYGLTSAEDKNDAGKATDAAIRFTMDNFRSLQKVLGRDPTPGELYLAHQQGSDGVRKLIQNPDRTAASVVGLKAVENNLPKSMKGRAATMKAGDFLSYWGTKFESGTAVIPPDDAMSVLENMPEYQQLDAADQIKVRESVATQAEKLRKEAAAAAKIDLQRQTVDEAVSQFEDRNEAAAYIKKTIADPDTREDALTMLNKEYDRIDENARIQEKKRYEDAYDGVSSALDAGDIAAAQQIADTAEISGEERTKLKDRIAKGDARKDDPAVLDGITALKIGTDQERRYFANVDGNGLNVAHLRHVLSRDTLEALAKEQETFRKRYENAGGKLPSFDDAGRMLDLRVRALGIKTGSDATPADIRYYETIRAIMSRNTEAAVQRAGRDLTPSEMEKVLDDTFMQFRGVKPGMIYGTNPATLGMKDVLERFDGVAEQYELIPDELVDEAVQALIDDGTPVTPENLLEALNAADDLGVFADRKTQRELKKEAQ